MNGLHKKKDNLCIPVLIQLVLHTFFQNQFHYFLQKEIVFSDLNFLYLNQFHFQ